MYEFNIDIIFNLKHVLQSFIYILYKATGIKYWNIDKIVSVSRNNDRNIKH